MRIQHNIAAMNSYRNYSNNVSAVNKNLEKLSSGYKINRAGDDAAGLAISEKMRAQISGLEAASKNAKDGTSLVKTAEGALTEVHDMLNRMVTLAQQSANGTYDNETDRAQLQKELNQLRTEIDRIADSSNFNGIKLMDGSLESKIVTKNMTSLSSTTDIAITPIRDGTPVKDPAKIEFTLNLRGYVFNDPTDDGSTAAGLTLGGVALTGTDDITGSTTGEQIANKVLENQKEIEIGGVMYDITSAGDGILKFTSQNYPDAQADGSYVLSDAALTVQVHGQDLTQGAPDGSNNGSGLGVTILNYGAPDNGGILATASFNLGDIGISDGTALQIGDQTYVFAVGEKSNFAGRENVVDLTDFKGSETDFLVAAAARLSKAAEGNGAVKVEVDGNDTATGVVYLTEKEGGLDRDKWDVYGPDDTANNDATWAGFVKTGRATIQGTGLTLQIGDTAEKYNQLNVNIGDIHTKALGISEISISTQESAQNAIDSIKNAINSVSTIRGTLGATQNRLEHTQNNLSVMKENIQDAESTIRDTDVAEEMMAYTKNNILVQSAQAMLAQANQIPQGVLQLLG